MLGLLVIKNNSHRQKYGSPKGCGKFFKNQANFLSRVGCVFLGGANQYLPLLFLQVSTVPQERRTLHSTVPEGAELQAECLLVRQVRSVIYEPV